MNNVINRRKFLRRVLALSVMTTTGGAIATPAHAGDDAPQGVRRGKWIEVELATQRLVAWEDGRMVLSTAISSGTRKTPTPKGTFRIFRKFDKQRMTGQDYDLPNVPWVMYFRKGGYAMHGTYWHSNFGQPMSHGCINLPIGDAAWLYKWAPMRTTVVIH